MAPTSKTSTYLHETGSDDCHSSGEVHTTVEMQNESLAHAEIEGDGPGPTDVCASSREEGESKRILHWVRETMR